MKTINDTYVLISLFVWHGGGGGCCGYVEYDYTHSHKTVTQYWTACINELKDTAHKTLTKRKNTSLLCAVVQQLNN